MKEKQLPDRKAGEEGPVQRKRRLGVVLPLTLCVMLLTCASAFATGGNNEDTSMTAVISSIDTLSSLLAKVWTLMTGNPYLTLFLALSLLSAGFGVFRRAKRTARR